LLIVIPSRIAVNLETDAIFAAGCKALRMIDRAPRSIRVESPIHAGVIANPTAVEALIRELLHQSIGDRKLLRPDFVISVPATGTSVHRHALVAVAHEAGARSVTLIEEGIAAALGADLPVLDPRGSLIIEVGAEKTEIAVVALGGVVASETAAVGGAHFCDAISQYLRRERHLLIGHPSAEAIKLEIGSAILAGDLLVANAKGHDSLRGLPSMVEVKSEELVRPIAEVLEVIVAAIRVVLEKTPPELSADIEEDGAHLSGGGSLLTGLAAFMQEALGLRVQVVADPSECVVRGAQRFAEDPRLRSEVLSLE
jgi:rod shape-determining protein MreB